LIIILLFPIDLLGQNNYMIKGETMSFNIQIIDMGEYNNSKFCWVKLKDSIYQYTPDEVDEYGFKDGRIFISKFIEYSSLQKKVFLERLVSGNTILYYYKGDGIGTYFFEKFNDHLIELPKYSNGQKSSFRVRLDSMMSDCEKVSDAIKLVSYNKLSLSKLTERYNHCTPKPFPHFKYGLTASFEREQLQIGGIKNEIIQSLDLTSDGGFSAGIFIDNPINVSDLSFYLELKLSKHGYSLNKLAGINDIDLIVNTSIINIPFMLRYTLPMRKIRPFVNAGGVYAYNFINTSALYRTTISNETIEMGPIDHSRIISDHLLGYIAGGGLEYKLNYRNSLFFELRYNMLYGLSNIQSMNKSGFNFITGINF
jgi:hypothetical protein